MNNSAPFNMPAKILASAADGVKELISDNSGDVDRIFGRANIKTNDLDNPYNEINLDQFCALFDQAAKQTGNDNFGLAFGADYQPKQLGPIGYAAISSPTLYAALKCLENYFPAHQGQTSFQLVQDADLMWLTYRIYDERIPHRRQDAELSLGVFVNIFRHVFGQNWSPLEVKFEHDQPQDTAEHERFFNAPVQFGRRANALAFKRSDLTMAMPTHDAYLYSIIEPFLKSRCQIDETTLDFAAKARECIKSELIHRVPTIGEVSQSMGMALPTFQRELRARGVTYSDLLTAARKELALHFLRDQHTPLTDVALRLGYSELSAFSRAFRAWTGQSPQAFRKNNFN